MLEQKEEGRRKKENGSRRIYPAGGGVIAGFNLPEAGSWKWFLILSYALCSTLYASDVKVKLNSANGSTSFQVRDSADVVVSSITSDGDAHFNSLTFPAGGIADLRVKNEDIIITSTFVAVAAQVNIVENTAWADFSPFSATLNVTQQPALIYAVFNSSSCRLNAAGEDTNNNFRILIDGNQAGAENSGWNELNLTDKGNLYALNSISAVWRVTSTGDKVVKVQQWHWGDGRFQDCTFSTFWVPCSP